MRVRESFARERFDFAVGFSEVERDDSVCQGDVKVSTRAATDAAAKGILIFFFVAIIDSTNEYS